jgi:hypothetical protein
MVLHNAHQSLKMALPGELMLSEVGPLAAEMQLPFV